MNEGPIRRPDVTFQRKDPQTYVVLVARAGPEGVLLGTQHFKPAGTEFATALDLFEAGFVPVEVLSGALRALGLDPVRLLQERVADPAVSKCLAERIARALRERSGQGTNTKRPAVSCGTSERRAEGDGT